MRLVLLIGVGVAVLSFIFSLLLFRLVPRSLARNRARRIDEAELEAFYLRSVLPVVMVRRRVERGTLGRDDVRTLCVGLEGVSAWATELRAVFREPDQQALAFHVYEQKLAAKLRDLLSRDINPATHKRSLKEAIFAADLLLQYWEYLEDHAAHLGRRVRKQQTEATPDGAALFDSTLRADESSEQPAETPSGVLGLRDSIRQLAEAISKAEPRPNATATGARRTVSGGRFQAGGLWRGRRAIQRSRRTTCAEGDG